MVDEKKIDVFAHRGGFFKEGETGPGAENTFERARHSLQFVDGIEIDVDFTADGVAVVTHDKLARKTPEGGKKKLNFSEFQQEYPKHATLESWLDWFAQPGMEERKLYLDLKGTEQDAFQLLELIQKKGLDDRVYLGTKDARTMVKMLLAREALQVPAKIFLQIPDPADAETAVAYTRGLLGRLGVAEKHPQLQERGPDGLHFFWPENLLKDIISELVKHGEFVSVTDRSVKVPWYRRFPNIPLFHDLQRARLKEFVQKAQDAGYEVMAGSAGSPETMQRMIEWGVKGIMPNAPKRAPDEVVREPIPLESIPEPRTQFINEAQLWDINPRLKQMDADTEAEKEYYDWVTHLAELQAEPTAGEKIEGLLGGKPAPGRKLVRSFRRWVGRFGRKA